MRFCLPYVAYRETESAEQMDNPGCAVGTQTGRVESDTGPGCAPGLPQYFLETEGRNNMEPDQTAPQTIDEYIAGFPPDVQAILQKIRAIIRNAAPGAEEAIKYQLPTFILNGNLVHFGAFKKHIGFYPTPTGTEKFKKELSVYQGAKGSVRFPLDKPIPYDLISQIVEFRVRESLEKAAAKGKKK